MSQNVDLIGAPLCSIDVYPYEGGSYTLIGAQVLECTTQKALRDAGGSAMIVLAPGGPTGQGFPSWAQVITLQSLVVIAMQRGSKSNVVFVGVVQEISESQDWQTGKGVSRNTQIQCADWGAWFQSFNWSAMSFLAVTLAQVVNTAAGSTTPSAAVPNLLSGGQQSTNPAQIANNWYNTYMAGTLGVLANTQVRYNGEVHMWPAVTTAFFETYPYDAIFPASNFFLSQDGTWYSKFSEILEDPYYELIIGTAPINTWIPATNSAAGSAPISSIPLAPPGLSSPNPTAVAALVGPQQTTQRVPGMAGLPAGLVDLQNGGSAWATPGIQFASNGIPNAVPACAQIVGRICPLPDLKVTPETQASVGLQGQPAYVYSGVDVSRWLTLTAYELDPSAGFSTSATSLSMSEYYNFFVLNPTVLKQIFGLPSGPGVFMWAYAGAANIAGIHRYGLNSMVRDTLWMTDSSFQVGESDSNSNLQNLVAGLTTRLATFYTPLPLMENAQVDFRLLPDIFVGNIFIYSPYRGDVPWAFYINSVTHTWRFGGPSLTTLGLERGLPLPVYENPVTLQQILVGNAQRFKGFVVSGLPANSGPGLQTFSLAPGSIQAVLGEIAQVLVTPGMQ